MFPGGKFALGGLASNLGQWLSRRKASQDLLSPKRVSELLRLPPKVFAKTQVCGEWLPGNPLTGWPGRWVIQARGNKGVTQMEVKWLTTESKQLRGGDLW